MNSLTMSIGLLILYIILICTNADRVKQKMYEPIQGDMACFKRFNATHEIGCSSGFWGNVGVIHLIDSRESFDWFLEKGPHSYYMLAILPQYFTEKILQTAWDSGKLSGAVLLDFKNISKLASFSGDQTCPNSISSLYKNNTEYKDYCERNPWNPKGSSLLYKNWHFPIFYINNQTSVENIMNCYKEFNHPTNDEIPRDWPLCAMELKSSMFATTNSQVCLRRSESLFAAFDRNFCDPLEDSNIYGFVKPLTNETVVEDQSIIIVAASADAFSMFDGISPGAESAVSGLVTLLATAEALQKYSEHFITSKNVMFVIYEGESWDYIGSSRMVYDMSEGQFPYKPIEGQLDQMPQINLTAVDAVIDLKQLALASQSGLAKNLFLHIDPVTHNKRSADLSKILITEALNYNLNIALSDKNTPLPPSSLQSFLKKMDISGFVLTDHDQEYKNNYYQSVYDDYSNVNYASFENGTDENDELHKHLTNVASTLASSLFNLLTDRQRRVEADPEVTNNLLYCYLKDVNCTYFREYSNDYLNQNLEFNKGPGKMYVSVQTGEITLSHVAARMLSFYMGTVVDLNQTDCIGNNTQTFAHTYFPYIENGTCMKSTMHYSSAKSPAFIIEDYDMESGEYSTWTESTWQVMSGRIFLKPSPLEEGSLLAGGIFSVVSSSIIIYFLHNKANVIFGSETPPTPC